ncbi:hypothetical protein CU669_15190 [Paramagnetospirillum kuznetsovii]|uniref:Uncharacterized protein n=1 Tax=Paramagnetospirillum kuznetsovii TaxID=2053833 RepID=A0A364NVL0_9PROT|nr:hypothetical protein [Paramagnetospirillum kuznetsovii]RAU21096.1 hypothetical protein CU669_15190 [Paramagnetospirillum kuznetsovii]
MALQISAELAAVQAALASGLPTRHTALMRDLLIFIEDAGNMACDQGFDCLSHRADDLFVRVQRELGM